MPDTMKAAVVHEFGKPLKIDKGLKVTDTKPDDWVVTTTLENINDVFSRMQRGDIEGRVGLDLERGQPVRP